MWQQVMSVGCLLRGEWGRSAAIAMELQKKGTDNRIYKEQGVGRKIDPGDG